MMAASSVIEAFICSAWAFSSSEADADSSAPDAFCCVILSIWRTRVGVDLVDALGLFVGGLGDRVDEFRDLGCIADDQ